MIQNELLTPALATVGAEISHELGAKMVKDFQDANPSDVKAYQIGRNIINQILAQPGCVGIRFFNGLDEEGKKTLVYVGVDAENKLISQYTHINSAGEMETKKAIVADRVIKPTDDDAVIDENWGWF
jgi:hypothetical protein